MLETLLTPKNHQLIGQLITLSENEPEQSKSVHAEIEKLIATRKIPVLGITGTGGSGKSSLVDELVRRYLLDFQDKTIAIVSVDPSKRKTGGALLGDRIRMNSIDNPRVYMRSLATRQSNLALSKYVQESIDICKAAGFDLIIVETSGIGQSDTEIVEHSDVSLYVMTSEYGAATQLEKIDMLDFADMIAINKFDKKGSLDALRDVKKQYKRNHNLWETPDDKLPIYGTIASQFNDTGTNLLYVRLMEKLVEKTNLTNLLPTNFTAIIGTKTLENYNPETATASYVIPPSRVRYLAEIAENAEKYDRFVAKQCDIARKMYQLNGVIAQLRADIGKTKVTTELTSNKSPLTPEGGTDGITSKTPPSGDGGLVVKAVQYIQGEPEYLKELIERYNNLEKQLDNDCKQQLQTWEATVKLYKADKYQFQVRDKIIEQDLYTISLSHNRIPKISLPKYQDWGDILQWIMTENTPGFYPYTAGVFPLKREGEDPARMFAGEGGPERTNKRFHFVSQGLPAKRLSTAFDSVTLYGENPDYRPDIYGKIGNSGVSIATVDDAKKLYSGFDLCNPNTSVSMTINGPAPMLLAFFMNAAIDQQCEMYIKENNLQAEVEAKIAAIYSPLTPHRGNNSPLQGAGGLTPPSGGGGLRPSYNKILPIGNEGLGLKLLGVSGDQVLPKEVYEKIKAKALSSVRGTVQADILKEDQAQNTCIFSTEFALRMMGDVQQYFITEKVRNFYSVSISGYHIAEAGANPISQLAFTLSNGFTFVEYYLSRGMNIDDFAPNFSFFFSNGMDPEYAVMGRVARRIWAKAIKYKYKGNERSQKLKYHIQTSGRSLHAQEIAFNDIRTTLQALYAIYDNCNSLHTNAYDEAITTPTEESVRRALAIQLIINNELGLARNENPIQGAFIIEELTDLVEEAVMKEFLSISERGGVLGAMERMYQRSKVQEESMYYEMQKHDGSLPLIGVNTFLDPKGSPTVIPQEVIRSTKEEKDFAISSLNAFHKRNESAAKIALANLQKVAIANGNLFESLMEAAKVCSLGQMSAALYEVGGQYRRNM